MTEMISRLFDFELQPARSNMSKSNHDSQLGQFLIITYDDEGEAEAAAAFRSAHADSYLSGKQRAEHAGVKRFQVYRIESGEGTAALRPSIRQLERSPA